VDNYAIAADISADGSGTAVRSNASMRPRRAYGAHRALRHVASAIGKFAGPVWPLAPIAPAACAETPITCTLCGGDHVCPMDWGEKDEDHWWVRSRCGDCGVWSEVIVSNAQAAVLDITLSRQLGQILASAERLDAQRMAESAEAFAAALRCDLIVAADFRTPRRP
jgi:hypothetical protein